MKKLFLFLTILASCNMQPMPTFGQTSCAAPTSLTYKNGDIAFYPSRDTVSVYTIQFNSAKPIPVSTADAKDTKLHYYTSESKKFKNYSIGTPSRGDTLRVKAFCIYTLYSVPPDGWHIPVTYWSLYQDSVRYFSYPAEIIIK